MNILGISPIQIIIILMIMLVVAGPKRMIEWAYHLGKYTAQIRGMVNEAMAAVQKEMAESGIDVTKDLADIRNAGFDIVKEASKVMNIDPITTTPPVTPPAAPSTPVTPTPAAPSSDTASTPAVTEPTASETAGGSANAAPNSPATSNDDKSRYDAWLPN